MCFTILSISSFCLSSQDNSVDSVASSFDSSTDCSLLEVIFGKEQYLTVCSLNCTFKIFPPDLRCKMSFGIIVFEIPYQIFS